MDLSIIIVNWNSIDYLLGCVSSITCATEGILSEIIVVDNNSPKGDAELIERYLPSVKVIKSATNLGFAGANNLGFRESSGEYILFLNPDTKALEGAIRAILDITKSLPDVGIAGCRLLNEDLSVQTSCIQTFPTILNQVLDSEWLRRRFPKSKLWGIEALSSASCDPAKVEVISGACMLVKREVFENLGHFTESYFMYAEDLDLCYKSIKAGYSNYYIPVASIIHFGGKSSNLRWATQMKWQAITHFCERHRGRLYALLFRAVMSSAAMSRIVIISMMDAADMVIDNHRAKSDASVKWRLVLRTLVLLPSLRPSESDLNPGKRTQAIT